MGGCCPGWSIRRWNCSSQDKNKKGKLKTNNLFFLVWFQLRIRMFIIELLIRKLKKFEIKLHTFTAQPRCSLASEIILSWIKDSCLLSDWWLSERTDTLFTLKDLTVKKVQDSRGWGIDFCRFLNLSVRGDPFMVQVGFAKVLKTLDSDDL